ncbi:hypothetical protein [uncultured Modestobacter sp.]|uniref:hypothetical protein n=1 Tax=uncultured Modestobacter sp. TaxID=380048 RepID=UPI00262C493B|nr:hypothetical protein [uncultured Modestobacter sp.]
MVSTDLVIPTGVRTRDWPRAVQCSATKDDGQRCRRRATRGARVCFVHGAQLPSVRAAAEAEVTELRTRALSIADRALDVVEDALEDKDPQVRLRASAQLLDRVLPRQQAGTSVSVSIAAEVPVGASPAEVIRARLLALREAQQQPVPSTEPEALEWTGEPVEGEVIDPREAGDGDWS